MGLRVSTCIYELGIYSEILKILHKKRLTFLYKCDNLQVHSKSKIDGAKEDCTDAQELRKENRKMNKDFITLTIGRQKNIALIAHDQKKQELISWCYENSDILKKHFLCGTGTTAKMITDKTGLPVKGYSSGPLGGDLQIGAKIVEGRIDFIVFFSDPLTAQPHDPDVKALLRVAEVYDIPIANNKATADFMITSALMDQEYNHDVVNFRQKIEERAATL